MQLDLNFNLVDLNDNITNIHVGETIGRALCTCGEGNPVFLNKVGKCFFNKIPVIVGDQSGIDVILRNIAYMPNMQGLNLVTALRAQAIEAIEAQINFHNAPPEYPLSKKERQDPSVQIENESEVLE